MKTHRLGITASAHLYVNNGAALRAKRPGGEMDKGALPQALVKWNWCAHDPGRLDNGTRQRGDFL